MEHYSLALKHRIALLTAILQYDSSTTVFSRNN